MFQLAVLCTRAEAVLVVYVIERLVNVCVDALSVTSIAALTLNVLCWYPSKRSLLHTFVGTFS